MAQRTYRKKPLEVEAVIFNGQGGIELFGLHLIDSDTEWICRVCGQPASKHGNVKTTNGFHIACPGDYIVRDSKGKHFPWDPESFKDAHELVR